MNVERGRGDIVRQREKVLVFVNQVQPMERPQQAVAMWLAVRPEGKVQRLRVGAGAIELLPLQHPAIRRGQLGFSLREWKVDVFRAVSASFNNLAGHEVERRAEVVRRVANAARDLIERRRGYWKFNDGVAEPERVGGAAGAKEPVVLHRDARQFVGYIVSVLPRPAHLHAGGVKEIAAQ